MKKRNFLSVLALGISGGYLGHGIIDPWVKKLEREFVPGEEEPIEERAEDPTYSAVRENPDQWEGELVLFESYRVVSVTSAEDSDDRYVVVFSGGNGVNEDPKTLWAKTGEPVPQTSEEYDVYARVQGITSYQSITGVKNAVEIEIVELQEPFEETPEPTATTSTDGVELG